jgi:hypothetical protein
MVSNKLNSMISNVISNVINHRAGTTTEPAGFQGIQYLRRNSTTNAIKIN